VITPSPIRIGSRLVGPGHPAYLVAELSANHNGELSRALETIHAAAEAGADAVKFQTYTADTITIRSDRPEFVVGGPGPWAGRTLYDLYQEAHTPWEWHPKLFEEARARGLAAFSTPFDPTAVELLRRLGAPAFKVASFELVDDALLEAVAATGKPVVLSTGMATAEEILHAIGVLRDAGCRELVLLRCTSSYPAPDDAMHLSTIPQLQRMAACPVGLSDHSLGTTAPIVAVTLGGCLIEKHFTLSRKDGGVDSHFSLEPHEFRELVRDVRRVEALLGTPTFGPGIAEEGNVAFRRSLYVVADIPPGGEFTSENVRSIRPGFGLSPKYLALVLGRRAPRRIARGTPLSWDLIFS
jgi:pseudaminic acid synthase